MRQKWIWIRTATMWYYTPNAHPIIQHTALQYHIVCGGGGHIMLLLNQSVTQ